MPRQRREDWPGAWHHVMNRGARRDPIFKVDEHCDTFLACVGDVQKAHGIEVHAYALMPNHYHLLVRSVRGNLSDAMRSLGGRYTRWVNQLHGWDGPIFRGRFRNQVLRAPAAIHAVFAYIHLNPMRAKLVPRIEEERAWTSHRAYVGLELSPEWLSRDVLLDELGGAKGVAGHVQSVWDGSRPWPDDLRLDDGWFLPPPKGSVSRAHTDGPPRPTVDPERVLAEVERITGTSRDELRRARRGAGANPARRFAAWALDRFTSLQQKQAGALLDMSESQTSHLLARLRRQLPASMDAWNAALEKSLLAG